MSLLHLTIDFIQNELVFLVGHVLDHLLVQNALALIIDIHHRPQIILKFSQFLAYFVVFSFRPVNLAHKSNGFESIK
jgi:hypothetical protein